MRRRIRKGSSGLNPRCSTAASWHESCGRSQTSGIDRGEFPSRPDEFTVTVYGTRGTLRLDVQNMLALRARLGRGPRSIARGKMVVASCVRVIGQVAWNAGALALGRWGVPGDVGPLIRAHYASLAAGGPPAVAPTDGKRTVDIIRQVWPLDRRTPRGAGSPTPTDG